MCIIFFYKLVLEFSNYLQLILQFTDAQILSQKVIIGISENFTETNFC